MKIILLNGPPRAGKDTISDIIAHEYGCGSAQLKFAQALKEGVHALLGLRDEFDFPLAHDAFEDRKDEPLDEFFGLTPRAFYIEASENLMKPVAGNTAFGRILARRIEALEEAQPEVVLVSDSGFRAEAEELVNRFGADAITLVRVRREGHDFTGDSRSYINLSDLGVETLDVWNDGDVEDLYPALHEVGLISEPRYEVRVTLPVRDAEDEIIAWDDAMVRTDISLEYALIVAEDVAKNVYHDRNVSVVRISGNLPHPKVQTFRIPAGA